jgi:hypothetical protein
MDYSTNAVGGTNYLCRKEMDPNFTLDLEICTSNILDANAEE